MAKQVLNNGETHGVIRGKANDNFTELYNITDSHLAEYSKYSDTTEKKAIIDKFHKMVSDAHEGKANVTYIMVGDSTRDSNGAWVYKYVSEALKAHNVNTYLSAMSGLKAEHWSTYTPDLQPGYITINDIIPLIPDTGANTVVDICLGINDGDKTVTEIEAFIKYGIDQILASKTNTQIIITSPNNHSNTIVMDKLKEAYKNLSETNGYGYINVAENLFKIWDTNMRTDYFVDDTHPNELGQRKIAEYIISKLLPNYKNLESSINFGGISVGYYKKIATVILNAQYQGFYGTFTIQALPGEDLMAASARIHIAITQVATMGSDATKSAVIEFSNFESTNADFNKTSIVLRTRSMSVDQTIVDIYLKNITASYRSYKVAFIGDLNVINDSWYLFGNDRAELSALGTQAVGSTDANATYRLGTYLGSPDGSLWKITVTDAGVVTATKKT